MNLVIVRLLEDLLRSEERKKKKAVKCLGSRFVVSPHATASWMPMADVHTYIRDTNVSATRTGIQSQFIVCCPDGTALRLIHAIGECRALWE